MSTKTNPLLEEARKKASFPIREMTYVLYEREENVKTREKIQQILDANPIFDKSSEVFMNHQQLYERSVQKSVEFIKTVVQNGWTLEEGKIAYTLIDSVR